MLLPIVRSTKGAAMGEPGVQPRVPTAQKAYQAPTGRDAAHPAPLGLELPRARLGPGAAPLAISWPHLWCSGQTALVVFLQQALQKSCNATPERFAVIVVAATSRRFGGALRAAAKR